MEGLGEFGVVTHPVAVAADVNDVAVMDEAIDECSGHDVVAKDFAPLFEAFIGSEDRGEENKRRKRRLRGPYRLRPERKRRLTRLIRLDLELLMVA